MKLNKIFMAILFFMFVSCNVFAQVSARTNTGKIVTKKVLPFELDKTDDSPLILVVEPYVIPEKEFSVSSRKMTVKIKATDPDGIKEVFINKVSAARMENDIFLSDVYLENGLNEIPIVAEDGDFNSTTLVFRIISLAQNAEIPMARKNNINIIEPVTEGGREIVVSEKSITVRIKTENENDKVTINGKKAESLQKGEHFLNVALSEGLNRISVKVKNNEGFTDTDTLRVMRKTDIFGPVIRLIEPAASRGIQIVRKTEVMKVSGTAEDESGIFQVTINERPAKVDNKGRFNLDVYLTPGENRLIISATDNKRNTASDTFFVTRTVQDMITTGKYFALIIGVNSYKGYWPPLKNCVNDASELGALLEKEYYFTSVFYLLDQEATRKNIINKLEWLSNNVSKDDNVLIFYAGHGQFNKTLNKGYWVPVDATTNSVAEYVSNNDLKTFMGGIQSRHTFLITDACFAGDIFRGAKTESISFDPNNLERYYREVYRKQSRLAMTSGGIEEVMDEGREGHSIFSYYLIKALKENRNKYLDASQLYQEFRIAVTNNSEQTPLLQVVRDTYDEGGQFIFVKK